jgi:cobalt-zinc-cadmium resistance protein CzcA
MNLFDRIINFSIKNKLFIGAFTIGLIVWGVFSASRLPIDAVPDITNPFRTGSGAVCYCAY